MSQEDEVRNLSKLTAVLMDYGWFVPPFVMRSEIVVIEALTAEIAAKPPTDDSERSTIVDRIHKHLLDAAFSTKVRARYVWLAMRTPHIREFSHVYESAIHAYYKREYPAAVCLLLVAFEGMLLSLKGWRRHGGAKKPSFPDLVATIKKLPLTDINPVMNATQEVVREALTLFVSKWLYRDTNTADFTLSVLNRHYVLHGLESGNFYRPQDMHRLLFAMDMLIDLVAMAELTWRPLIEADIEVYQDRELFYRQLSAGAIPVRAAGDREQELLLEHANFVRPSLEAIIELG